MRRGSTRTFPPGNAPHSTLRVSSPEDSRYWPLAIVHRVIALAGIAAALLLLPLAWHRRHVAAGFLAVALLALPLSAAITGGLSTPHDRYQSRIVWLPAAMAFLTVPSLLGRRFWAVAGTISIERSRPLPPRGNPQ